MKTEENVPQMNEKGQIDLSKAMENVEIIGDLNEGRRRP